MTRCSITCAEPGCTNKIYYTVADKKECISFCMPNDKESDEEVPLYCERHRTEEGRHSAVRTLKKPAPVVEGDDAPAGGGPQ